ncbi:hypothetical protein F5Y04DRAFT_285191 [Hypomontagnella monticulosa]|nr:hypothetical protein F5Y04DRAFT_285191 [Hypomontagnella monticulosa]
MPLTTTEVAKHNTTSSCWIVVDGKVYDVTSYLGQHPGGAAILLRQGGRDATAEFRKVHSPDVLEYLPKEGFLGTMDPAAAALLGTASASRSDPAPLVSSSSQSSSALAKTGPPHIAHCVVLSDFEAAAKRALPQDVLSYIASSSNSGLSLQNNLSSWSRVSFRPRILRGVRNVSPRSAILGHASPFPFYATAMGLMGRGHAGNETDFVRGLARRGIHGLISSETSVSMEDIMGALKDEQQKIAATRSKQAGGGEDNFSPSQLHFQLYVHSKKSITDARIRRAKAAGFRSCWVTVDTPVLGKRTSDRRLQAAEALDLGLDEAAEQAAFGRRSHVAPDILDPGLSWADLEWIKRDWGGPLVLKGVQCAEDARLALKYGCDGILLSNHGGRQAHTAPDALTTLLEIRTYCPEVLGKLEIFVDGGLRDGADVLKAICLGATAVGVGRPLFYALGTYGSKGVERCIDILSEELAMGMRLLGITSLDDARPDGVNASRLLNYMWQPKKSRL